MKLCKHCGNTINFENRKIKICDKCREASFKPRILYEKRCIRCHDSFTTARPRGICCDSCVTLNKQKRVVDSKNLDDFVVCPLCSKKVKAVTLNHVKVCSNIRTEDDFKEVSGGNPLGFYISKNVRKKLSIHSKRDSNPFRNHGGKYSVFSLENPNSTVESIQKYKSKVSETNKLTSKRSIRYWTDTVGLSEEAARLALSRYQRHFSRKICIEKYGIEEGEAIWKDRQIRWQATLNAKSVEEKYDINRRKRPKKFVSVSKSEKELILLLRDELGHEVVSQLVLKKDDGTHYIYDIVYKNKIVEFDGDFWHCNPSIFKRNDIHPIMNRRVDEIWNSDLCKEMHAKNLGYEVLRIWESDFVEDKMAIVRKCVEWMK